MDYMVKFCILYGCTTNAIIATPVKNMKEEKIVGCFKQNIEYIIQRGFKPVLNFINNVVSQAVQAYLEKENM